MRAIARKRYHEPASDHVLTRWWCGKYNRPANDPLLLNRTYADLSLEMLEDLYARRDELKESLRGASPSTKARISRTLVHIRRALEGISVESGAVLTGDPVIDRIEEMLARGEDVDLEAELLWHE